MQKELIAISNTNIYNVQVQYFGNDCDVLGMLRLFDVWKSKGDLVHKRSIFDDDEIYPDFSYSFELPTEIYDFFKTEYFATFMKRKNIDLILC